MERFIESEKFPAEIVSLASAPEKGPGRPPYWEMVFWWTRKPLAGARAVIAASLLPKDISPEKFLQMIYPGINLNKCKGKNIKAKDCFPKTPHYLDPKIPPEYKKFFENAALLDPFAGFGSIPLEAIRLGVGHVVAVELLPTAVIFLRAILEYPRRIASDPRWKNFIQDLKEAGEKIIEELRNDPDIRELYDDDAAVYIGTWEIRCPYCGKYTPAIGNWWLARVKKGNRFEKLVYMKPVQNGDQIDIEVVDLTREAQNKKTKLITSEGKTIGVIIGNKKYEIGDPKLHGKPNIDPRRQELICLHCHTKIKGTQKQWTVKQALQKWNQLLEQYLEGKISLDQLKQAPARPRILVKVKIKNRDLEFLSATPKDNEKLWKALQKLKQHWGDPDIPAEELWKYTSGTAGNLSIITWGFNKFYKLFNPRQLLIIIKLVKLIRDIGKRIKENKLREGWSEKEAYKYSEAVTTYLAMALCKYSDYSSIISIWNPSLIPGHTITFRGLAVVWNWTESSPFASFTGTWSRNLRSSISALLYLVIASSGKSDGIRVLHDDTTVLSKLREEKLNIIVTDPPYKDDVPYAELSDFYFVWLKRALSDNDGFRLLPLFHSDVLFDEFGEPISTQWEVFAGREVDYNPGRLKYFGAINNGDNGEDVYRDMLARVFRSLAPVLKEDGLLVTYFAHSSPEAWRTLFYGGWSAGFYPVNAFPLLTESLQSVVSRGKAAISSSIVVVWRRGAREGVLDLAIDEDKLLDKLVEGLQRFHRVSRSTSEVTGYVMTYARALGLLAQYRVVRRGSEIFNVDDYVWLASRLTANAYARESGARIRSDPAVFYYLIKKLFVRLEGRARRIASSGDLIMLGYGFTPRNKHGKEKPLEIFVKKYRILGFSGRRERATGVASRKMYILLEPTGDDEASLLELLNARNVRLEYPNTIKNTVDMLHVLEYYSFRPRNVFRRHYDRLRSRLPSLVEEAVELAKAISGLGEDDPEARICRRILDYLGETSGNYRRGTLDDWLH